jgi:hypothetical protein
LVPQRQVLTHQGALAPDTTEEAGEDEGDHAGHHRSGRPKVNVDGADGVSRSHRLWFVYRIVRGWLRLTDGRLMYG